MLGDNPAILSGPVPVRRDWRKVPRAKLTRAERAMAFAEKHLVVPEGRLVGKPIRLADFQEDFFYAVFDNAVPTREAILSMARKNAKTATIAIVVLVFLVGPEAVQNTRIVSGALAKEQAAEVYNYASKMAAMSPTLSNLVRAVPSSKQLHGLPMNTHYKALAAEGATAHGGSPYLAILDEAGQVRGPYNAFFEAVVTSQGAYDNPLRIWISTQAPTDGDLFNRLIDDAAAARDPSIVCHVYRAPDGCALDDREAWLAANPALGLFKATPEVEDAARKAARLPQEENSFRWLHLNQRINPVSPFLGPTIWRQNDAAPIDEAFVNGNVYGGIDLSQTTDLTAFILSARWRDEWHIRPFFFMAEELIRERARADRVPYDIWHKQGLIIGTPGHCVALDWVAGTIGNLCKGMNIVNIGFDPHRFDFLSLEMARQGYVLPFKKISQGFSGMSGGITALEEAALQRKLRHGGNPVLAMCISNARIRLGDAGGRMFAKTKSTGRIDGAVALAMAMGVAAMEKVEAPRAVDPARRGLILA